MKQVKVKKLHELVSLPKYATEGAGCFDIKFHSEEDHRVCISANSNLMLTTGLAFEIPEDHAIILFSRSGHGKKGISLANGCGVIDSDYRGELGVILQNSSNQPFVVTNGDRIAQAMIIPVPQWELVEVEELSETVRGSGGFGSTGK